MDKAAGNSIRTSLPLRPSQDLPKRLAIVVVFSRTFTALLTIMTVASGCAKVVAVPHAVSARPSVFSVVAVTLTNQVSIESHYELHLRGASDDERLVRTARTRGTIQSGDNLLLFDSATPTPSDPWPLLLQHAVSSSSSRIRFSEQGAPEALTNLEHWTRDALGAIQALEIPVSENANIDAMLNPDAVLHDLRSIFPGMPTDGQLTRSITVGGIKSTINENCERSSDRRDAVWQCAGNLESIGGPNARVFNVTTNLTLAFSARGMIRMESEYIGTAVGVDPATGEITDQPIGGKRLVVRQ